MCVDAILECEELGYSFPTTDEELTDAADAYASISTMEEAISGCVACLDGYLLAIQTPSSKETGHVKSYFSGHYHKYGVNIQAACDASLRFVYVCVAAPGGTNDITAFRKTKLNEIVEKLPMGKYVIGDAAYVCSETLLTPFSGALRHLPGHDDYNFYISQLRIRIEQAFGLMTVKWQILKKPLQLRLKNVGSVFLCITRLHNFCINERLQRTGDFMLRDENDGGGFPRVTEEQIQRREPDVPAVPGNSAIREMLVQQLQQRGMTRPE